MSDIIELKQTRRLRTLVVETDQLDYPPDDRPTGC
jgi:hypothetical protein